MEIEKDLKILKQLDVLRTETPNIYFNLKRNIDAAYRMYLYAKAEQDFRARFTHYFDCYSVDSNSLAEFSSYCGVPNADKIYFYVKKTGNFAMLFCVNENDYVSCKVPVYSQEDVEDILFTFHNELILCAPDEIF